MGVAREVLEDLTVVNKVNTVHLLAEFNTYSETLLGLKICVCTWYTVGK